LEFSPTVAEDELRDLALRSDKARQALHGVAVQTVIVRAPDWVNIVPSKA